MPRARGSNVTPLTNRASPEETMTAAKEAMRLEYGIAGESLDGLIFGLMAKGLNIEIRIGVHDGHRKSGRVRLFAGYSRRIV